MSERRMSLQPFCEFGSAKCQRAGHRGKLKDDNLQHLWPNKRLFKHFHHRQYSPYPSVVVEKCAESYTVRQLPRLLQEKEYKVGDINKVFASDWVSDRQVVFGTKCNKLKVMDLITKQIVNIPMLKSSPDSDPADCPCGIHSIAVNPSKTLLATGGINTNDLAVYKLPTFDPVCLGEFGHTDWIFDVKWLDDEFVVSGSRDNSMALWCIKEEECLVSDPDSPLLVPDYSFVKPKAVRICKKAEKVRAMAYNSLTQELVALSLNGFLHLWDANKFIQKAHQKLVHLRENVCMGVCEKHNLYGVGSQSHVALVDPRSLKQINHVLSKQRGCGIRSLSFREDMMTIGTGAGSVYFYDLRASRYMEQECGHHISLQLGKGWLKEDDTYRDFFFNTEYPNAVYTHCFDDSGSKLFAAGGPLPAGLWGNYAGVWY